MNLDDFMRAEEITDQAMADTVGVSRPYIWRIRRGLRRPSLPVAIKLAEATKLPIEAFVGAK